MNSYPEVYFPPFNDDHTLSPSGDEPVEERWTAWNDLDFDWGNYQRIYWFWLGEPTNSTLAQILFDAEEMISWSTCRHFRVFARQSKGSGLRVPPKARHPETLRFSTEIGYGRVHPDLPQVKAVLDSRSLWTPPTQLFLNGPDNPPSYGNGTKFSKRLAAYRAKRDEERKLIKTDRVRRTKPRIAPRTTNRGAAQPPRKR